ncbi:MAG: Verru_Chthon cassette protein A, partial [Akkermansiaceae bacterium]|nr:Verru_Chthon cassette protein A [Akkermansiaceae bacterium]
PRVIRSLRGFPFHSSSDCAISTTAGLTSGLTLVGTDLVITLKSGATGETVQQINMSFPDMRIPRPYVWGAGQSMETSLLSRLQRGANEYQWSLIRPGDVVRSMEADKDALPKGDLRFYSATPVVPADWFRPGGAGRDGNPSELNTPQWNSTDIIHGRFAHGLRQYNSWQFWGQFCSVTKRGNGNDSIQGTRGDHPYFRIPSMQTAGSLIPKHHLYTDQPVDDWAVYRDAHFVTARGLKGAFRSDRKAGDFDSGFGFIADGPYVNKPDEGNAYSPEGMSSFQGGNPLRTGAYYNLGNYETDTAGITTFPNRQIASAIQFGSLPTGIKRGQPWQTLLFTPAPSGPDHPGAKPPHDHLVADWWWMPAAQPYPISQPMATSGKINLNYDILPFRYIKRRTPIHSLLKAVQITAVPPYFATRHSTQGKNNNYRQGLDAPVSQASRYKIDTDHVNGTLKGFENRFKDGKLFRSATEICEVFLVPEPLIDFRREYPAFAGRTSYDGMEGWWRGRGGLNDPRNFSLTGDNLREAPYNYIYPRCTTKSNTFRVHLHVQRLIPAGLDPSTIDLSTARVGGKWRGSVLVERFVDPNDEDLPDFAKETNASLDDHYRLRVLERKEFKPL